MGSGLVDKVECPHCGKRVYKDDVVEVEVSRQTHWEPAEYEQYCHRCIPARFKYMDRDRYDDRDDVDEDFRSVVKRRRG